MSQLNPSMRDKKTIYDCIATLKSVYNNEIHTCERACVIVSVHADDEIYLTSSMVLNYPFKIFLVTPFLGDMSKTKASRDEQLYMFYSSVIALNVYRNEHGFEPIFPIFEGFGYRPNGPLHRWFHDEFTDIVAIIEHAVAKAERIDYYIRSCESTHQNHCHANHISNAVLRSPYLDKIDCILTASYPNDFAVGNGGFNTAFQDMSEAQVQLCCEILDSIYTWKAQGRKALSSENFMKSLQFQGAQSSYGYSQWYQIDRQRLYGAHHNKILE